MTRTTGLRFRGVGVIAALLVVLAIAACGGESTPETTPTAAPTATPEPTPATPAPTPEPTPPPPALEDLRITAATTGAELVAHISEAEAACLSAALGDVVFRSLQVAPLLAIAQNEGAYALFADCLEQDHFVHLGTGLISAGLGGWTDNSLECATDVLADTPGLLYAAFGLDDLSRAAAGSGQGTILELFRCLEDQDKLGVVMVMAFNPNPPPEYTDFMPAPFSGPQLLAVLSEGEADCLRTTLTESVFALIFETPSIADITSATATANATPQIESCVSPETLVRVSGEILAHGFGMTNPDSITCTVEFSAAHPDYGGWLNQAAINPLTMSQEDFLELAAVTFKVFECMDDEELAWFQRSTLPILAP